MPTIAHALRELDDSKRKAELYRMWHTAHRAGFGYQRAMEMLAGHAKVGAAARLRERVLAGVGAGQSLADMTKAAPERFEPFEGALLALGEESGTLEQSLRLLADYFAAQHRLLQAVRQQAMYPLFTSLAAVVIAPLPLVFQGRGGLYMVTAGAGVAAWYTFGGAVVVGAARSYANRPGLVRARLARALATAIEAGLPLDRAVRLATDATAHPVVTSHVARFSPRVLATQPLSVTFANCPILPPEMSAALHIAEQTGDYTTTLRKLAALYEDGFK